MYICLLCDASVAGRTALVVTRKLVLISGIELRAVIRNSLEPSTESGVAFDSCIGNGGCCHGESIASEARCPASGCQPSLSSEQRRRPEARGPS